MLWESSLSNSDMVLLSTLYASPTIVWGSVGITDLKMLTYWKKPTGKDFGGLLQTLPSNRWYMDGEQIVFKIISLKDSVGLKLRFPGSSPVL